MRQCVLYAMRTFSVAWRALLHGCPAPRAGARYTPRSQALPTHRASSRWSCGKRRRDSAGHLERDPASSRVEVRRWAVKYLAVLEQGATGWGAYVPDLPMILAT